MLEKNYFIPILFFSMLLFAQTPLFADSSSNIVFNDIDNLLTTDQLQQSENDSAFTAMSYFPDQDATKTHHSTHYPFPPEAPHNDNILHILKDTIRFDHKKHSIQCKQCIELYSVHSPPQNHPSGNYIKPHDSKPITSVVLRI